MDGTRLVGFPFLHEERVREAWRDFISMVRDEYHRWLMRALAFGMNQPFEEGQERFARNWIEAGAWFVENQDRGL